MKQQGEARAQRITKSGNEATDHDESAAELSSEEKKQASEDAPKRVAVLHETIRLQGEDELGRTIAALWWSALAAGLSMGFSFLFRGVLEARFPEGNARFFIGNMGYTIGFLIVIIARQQLFTENTVTAVLPVMTKPDTTKFLKLLRLWSIVLLGNVVGALIFSYILGKLDLFDAATDQAFLSIGEELMRNSASQMFTKGMLSGWLIATMVWMIAAAPEAKLWLILIVTYLIGLGGFSHIVVGSAEVAYLAFAGEVSWLEGATHFAVPTLLGNIFGGTFIFALISHAQVQSDNLHKKS